MIRVALYLVLVGAIAYGVALLADRPGDVVITWQGLRIETSLMVMAAAVAAAMVVFLLLVGIVRAILRSPFVLRRAMHRRRGERAYEAISLASSPSAPATSPLRTDMSPKQSASRRPNRFRCFLRRRRRSLPAIAKPPTARSAPWRAAPTPRLSGCTVCLSRRGAATIR